MLRPVSDTVAYDVHGAVATLTLDRPDRLNAIVPELIRDLEAALDRAEADEAIRAIRLRGAGRAFCAGYDIGWGAEAMEAEGEVWDPMADQRMMSRFVRAYMRLWQSPKPVIAQVHGYCVGGGTDFALCSDLIVCADECRIGYPPARVWGSPTTAMWVYRLGLERAKRLLLTGDPLDGRTAVAWGLASESHPEAELDAAGLALASRVAKLPANQLQMMKLLVNQAYEQMGLNTTQLIGTLLDGAARHTPEGVAFTRAAARDVGDAVARARRAVRRLRAGEAMRRAAIGAVLACALVAGCGDSGPSDEQQVRQTLTDFGRATSAKDYQALCDRIFAKQLTDKLSQVGLPCEVAMQQSLGEVKDPRLTIGKITVKDAAATAEVRTSASGQQPSQDTVELRRVDGTWRISSLG